PSTRSPGSTARAPTAAQWATPLPPFAAACDYAFCKGANGALHNDWTRTPQAARGVFNIRPPGARTGVRIPDVTDGTSNTLAMGDATGGSPVFLVRDLTDPTRPR